MATTIHVLGGVIIGLVLGVAVAGAVEHSNRADAIERASQAHVAAALDAKFLQHCIKPKHALDWCFEDRFWR